MIKRYNTVPVLTDTNLIRYKKHVIYPDIPISEEDFYVITVLGDRYDKLAYNYYSDSSLWWVIASSNPQAGSFLTPLPGIQIRIPADKQLALTLYRRLNS